MALVKRLPLELRGLTIENCNLKLNALVGLLRLRPSHLTRLAITGNDHGAALLHALAEWLPPQNCWR